MMLRYVDTEKRWIEEQFAGFVGVEETAVSVLNDTILKELELLGLSINECHYQNYNGGNMIAVNTGVKTYILAINLRPFFFDYVKVTTGIRRYMMPPNRLH
jgi:hypothetical protein